MEFCTRCYKDFDPKKVKLVFACNGGLYCDEHCAQMDAEDLDDVEERGEWVRLEDIT